MSRYHVIFEKHTQRSVPAHTLQAQVDAMMAKAFTVMNLTTGWSFVGEAPHPTQRGNVGNYKFSVVFLMDCLSDNMDIDPIVGAMASAGAIPGWAFKRHFKDAGSAGGSQLPTAVADVVEMVPEENAQDIEIDLGDYAFAFSHIFERSAQISVVMSAIEAAKESAFEHRFNSVLYGPPGSGKTDITKAIVKMYGEEAIIKMDGPSCSKAGIENFFLNADSESPKILIFEEIEKADPETLKPLLAILDTRAEVRKTSGDKGQQSRDIKVLCIATVNNTEKFEKLHAGALASRFTHKIYCPRPSRECLGKILAREIHKVGGNAAWIEPTLRFVLDGEKCTDPRRAIAVCLSGRNRLLSGDYQRALRAINVTNYQAA